jgi:dihydroorotate dehydrogenase
VPGIGILKNPIGLAAGFDKNAVAPKGFRQLGFSMIEVGTVTPRAQSGNPKPRLFRYPEQKALINRMGFNNDGAARVAARLKLLKWNHEDVPIGVNCGKNKDTPNQKAVADYLQVIETFGDLAQYFVINISSPNTPGLRELATPEFVQALGTELGAGFLPKVWIKIDPDLNRKDFQSLLTAVAEVGYQGVILSNTHRVHFPEAGGQSGHPLTAASNTCLEWAYEVHKGLLPVIAAGGILSGIDVVNKIARGASAVQLYTALVYQGPWTVTRILLEAAAELKMKGYTSLEEAKFSHYS